MTQPPARPDAAELITYYDDANGERAGLTGGQIGGWSAATAALLTEECGLGPGSRVAVLLPPHWQTAAVLLGAWAAGIEVSFRAWSTAGLSPAGEPLDAAFVEYRRVGSWLDDVPSASHQFVLGLLPAAAPITVPPPGYRDYPTAVRPYLGAAAPAPIVGAHDKATVDGTTYAQYAAVAKGVAQAQRIGPGDRVLVDVAAHEQPLMWLLAPLSVGASVVLCANVDPARLDERVTAERVTRVLGR